LFFKRLREEFLKRAAKYLRKPRESKKKSPERPVERRSLTKHDDMTQFEYESSHMIEWTRESVRWSWLRVKEYYRQMSFEERYEKLVKQIKT